MYVNCPDTTRRINICNESTSGSTLTLVVVPHIVVFQPVYGQCFAPAKRRTVVAETTGRVSARRVHLKVFPVYCMQLHISNKLDTVSQALVHFHAAPSVSQTPTRWDSLRIYHLLTRLMFTRLVILTYFPHHISCLCMARFFSKVL